LPEYSYARQMPRSYPEARDAAGEIVGTVELGDTRMFGTDGEDKPDGAPDCWPCPDENWLPAGEQLPPAWPGVSADMYRALPDQDGGEESPDDGEAAPDSDPPPPPAGKRGKAAGDTSTPDSTSSEEQG
jgi:hypothetical protein